MEMFDSDSSLSETRDMEKEGRNCNECGKSLSSELDILFFCSSCAESEESDQRSFICSNCISPHASKNHSVMDVNGYEVAICENHRCIVEIYCVTCSVVICYRCTLSHSNHAFVPIGQKSAEVRKMVFKYINEFDLLTKDVKHYQNHQKLSLKSLFDDLEYYRLDTVDDILFQIFSEQFRTITSSIKWDDYKQQLSEHVQTEQTRVLNEAKASKFDEVVISADEFVNKLRGVLRLSDGFLIKIFEEMIPLLDGSLADQKTHLKSHVVYQPFHLQGQTFHKALITAAHTFLESIVWPTAKLCPVTEVHMEKIGVAEDLGSNFIFRSYIESGIRVLLNMKLTRFSVSKIVPFPAYCRGCMTNNGLFSQDCEHCSDSAIKGICFS